MRGPGCAYIYAQELPYQLHANDNERHLLGDETGKPGRTTTYCRNKSRVGLCVFV